MKLAKKSLVLGLLAVAQPFNTALAAQTTVPKAGVQQTVPSQQGSYNYRGYGYWCPWFNNNPNYQANYDWYQNNSNNNSTNYYNNGWRMGGWCW
ncbi:hypothetical protein [Desulfotomaculum nigrificans]|uniref:hypothetical protein n=1 Tax=Desulfotomaculum nigrificans TaxID=1565 RepID=UPI0001FAE783|nr:hypothetical protein [Desulfotomaculum nigrificans]MDA8235895.1 hypothetical protein [Clostridia bacterium]